MDQSPWQADQLNTLPQLAELFQKRWHGLEFIHTPAKPSNLLTEEAKLDWLRQNKIGRLTMIPIPHHWASLGLSTAASAYRSMLHLDYTASAQGLEAIENYLAECM